MLGLVRETARSHGGGADADDSVAASASDVDASSSRLHARTVDVEKLLPRGRALRVPTASAAPALRTSLVLCAGVLADENTIRAAEPKRVQHRLRHRRPRRAARGARDPPARIPPIDARARARRHRPGVRASCASRRAARFHRRARQPAAAVRGDVGADERGVGHVGAHAEGDGERRARPRPAAAARAAALVRGRAGDAARGRRRRGAAANADVREQAHGRSATSRRLGGGVPPRARGGRRRRCSRPSPAPSRRRRAPPWRRPTSAATARRRCSTTATCRRPTPVGEPKALDLKIGAVAGGLDLLRSSRSRPTRRRRPTRRGGCGTCCRTTCSIPQLLALELRELWFDELPAGHEDLPAQLRARHGVGPWATGGGGAERRAAARRVPGGGTLAMPRAPGGGVPIRPGAADGAAARAGGGRRL